MDIIFINLLLNFLIVQSIHILDFKRWIIQSDHLTILKYILYRDINCDYFFFHFLRAQVFVLINKKLCFNKKIYKKKYYFTKTSLKSLNNKYVIVQCMYIKNHNSYLSIFWSTII